jgi:hypothetical protein
VALRTPDRLCNCLGPVKTEARANASCRTADRGETKSSQALVFLAPASSSPSCDQAHIQLVCGAVMAQPVENRLARPIRSPLSSRRACVARWSQVIHRYPPLLESWGGEPVDSRTPCPVPLIENKWAVSSSYAHYKSVSMEKINFPCIDSLSIKHTTGSAEYQRSSCGSKRP